MEVYETHARMLLEHGDLNEFNQCQVVIQTLTTGGGGGADIPAVGAIPTAVASRKATTKRDGGGGGGETDLRQSDEAADEFLAYRVLYDVVQNNFCDLVVHVADCGGGGGGVSSPSRAAGPSLRHAMGVVKSILHEDYVGFFRLYETAPHMSAYLMDFLVRRVRTVGYARMMASYRPTISTDRVRAVLSFHDRDETVRFLKKRGAVFRPGTNGDDIDCKATYASYLKSANGRQTHHNHRFGL